MARRDVVIIGAPRSGTNMLRDVLTRRHGVVTWPCDEINAIWRHGSTDSLTDEIAVERATDEQRQFVQARFDAVRRRQHGDTVVEKTCANSLRVGYVHALMPAARFVLITRDGLDATASAVARWHAPVDWRYTARKARYVPPGDVARAGAHFGLDRLRRHTAAGHRVHTWGPRFEGIDELARTATVEEMAATQWQRCMALSRVALDRLPTEQVYRLRYEDFVRRPAQGLAALLDFLQLPAVGAVAAVAGVSDASVGKGRSSLTAAQLERVERVLARAPVRTGHV